MKKLRKLLIFLLITTIIIIVNCNGNGEPGTGVTTLPKISSSYRNLKKFLYENIFL